MCDHFSFLDYLKRIKEAEPELKTGYILAAAYGSYYKNEFVDFISIRSSLVTKNRSRQLMNTVKRSTYGR